jgi:hypothetical protein
MKKVLSLLVALVFTQVQTWALVGGPPLSGAGGLQSLSGTYSGVLTGDTSGGDTFALNSIGIFDLGVPTAQTAQGSMLIFLNGEFFQGGIVGTADPAEGTLTALASADHITAEAGGTGTGGVAFTFDGEADGAIQATFSSDGFSGLRFDGTAHFSVKQLNFTTFNFDEVGTAAYDVTGFLQTSTVNLPAADSVAGLISGN